MNTSAAGLDPSITQLGPPSVVSWFAIGGFALLVLAGLSARVVQQQQRAVISRLGRVVRVRGPGLACRLPGLERLDLVSLSPVRLPLVAACTTRDGVQVRVLANCLCRVTDPSRSVTAVPEPLGATASALESGLAKAVSHIALASLLPAREEIEVRVPQEATTVTSEWGMEVLELEVYDIETRLTAELLHSVHRPEPGDL